MRMRMLSKVVVVASLSFLFHTGCSVKVDSPQVSASVEPKIVTPANVLPKCTATLPAANNGIFASGDTILIEVDASGGFAPYSSVGVEKFASHTTVARTYTNDGTTNLVKDDFIEVRDGVGLPTICAFTVTITPTVNPSNLACSLVTNIASPQINQTFSLATTATGGTGTYTFTNLALGLDGVIVTALSGGTATGKYTSAGSHTLSVNVNDGVNSATCSKTITVRPALAVSLAATPGSSVPASDAITLEATAVGFSGTPVFNFTTNEPAIFIFKNGSKASVSSERALPHVFDVLVTATAGAETASTTIRLTFANVTPLTCLLKHTAATYVANDSVVFNVTTSTNETAEIVTFNAGTGATVTGTGSSRSVKYSAGGQRTLGATAKVRRNNVDVLCNGGATLTDVIQINNALSCNVYTGPNPSFIDDYYSETFDVVAQIPANSGSGSARIVALDSTGSYAGISTWAITSDFSREAYFSETGTFQVKVTVQDSSGKQATCSTSQSVQYYPYWWY